MKTPSMMYYLAGVLVMAIVTYLPRALPFALVRKKVESRFLQSFLHYMPVAVLSAMTFPSLLYATATPWWPGCWWRLSCPISGCLCCR